MQIHETMQGEKPAHDSTDPVSGSQRGWKHLIPLAAILALSTWLNFFDLTRNGYGNTYYSIAIKSMLMNWHNFFFLSFDPGGFVTVDKPPIDLWLQAASASLFGFTGWSLLLPQALAGVLSVLVLYIVIRNEAGPNAGLLSALMLAITPILVAISRNNNLDMMLVLVLLCATWAFQRTFYTGKARWLILSAALIGIGFNIKMLEAYLVLPAFGLCYLAFARQRLLVRLLHLSIALLILIVVSLSWITIVDLTPANQRPYVGSSQTNSELNLTLGWNGAQRLVHLPSFTNPQKTKTSTTALLADHPLELQTTLLHLLTSYQTMLSSPTHAVRPTIDKTRPLPPPQTGPMQQIAAAGLLRPFEDQLGGQIAWLIPLAAIGLLVLLWQKPVLQYRRSALFWGLWLITTYLFFCTANSFKPYYTITMAPAIAALAGSGLFLLWRNYRQMPLNDLRSWGLPCAIGASACIEVNMLNLYPSWNKWLDPLILGGTLIAVTLLIIARTGVKRPSWLQIQRAALFVGVSAMLLAPFTWSAITPLYLANGGSPVAGPQGSTTLADLLENQKEITPPVFGLSPTQEKLLSYVQTHRANRKFILGTITTGNAIPYIFVSGQPVMALGGFSGHDPILNTSKLHNLIIQKIIGFFWLPAIYTLHEINANKTGSLIQKEEKAYNQNILGGLATNATLVQWVNNTCRAIPTTTWDPTNQVIKTLPRRPIKPIAHTKTKGKKPADIVKIGNLPADQLFDCMSTPA